MIQVQRVPDRERTYRVVRNYMPLGFVAEPVENRGWVKVSANSLTNTMTGQALIADLHVEASRFAQRRTAAGYWVTYVRGYRSHATRTDAVRQLLVDAMYNPDEYAPARNAARRTPRRTSNGLSTEGRAFGVEMELTGPDSTTILSALRQAGIDVTDVGRYTSTNGSRWELKRDGSVNGHGLELVSPKLSGTAGFEELRIVCEALNRVSATVDNSCGLHVHHDFRGLDGPGIKRQALAFVERQGLIRSLVAPSRRENYYCPLWDSYQVDALRVWNEYHALRTVAYVGPRGALNLQAYARHGSVEVRYHGGTTNFSKIAAWVRFGQAIFAAGEAEADLSTTNIEALVRELTAYGLTTTDAAVLLRFVRVGETRATIEASIAAAQDLLAEVTA